MAPPKPTSLGPGTTYLRPELRNVKIIAVEEHVQLPQHVASLPNTPEVQNVKRVLGGIARNPALSYANERGTEVGAVRLQDMDEGDIAMQVISFGSALHSAYSATPEEGFQMAQSINDTLKKAVDANPTRFRAFAELPFHAPDLAIQELQRCHAMGGTFVAVMLAGLVGATGEFLDAPKYDALLSELERLDMPLFLHPGIPPKAVIDTYYDIPGNDVATSMMSSGAWGWHSEAGLHILRLAVTGTLDRHPKLKIIAGHLGEMLPFMIQRFDAAFVEDVMGLKRSVGEALRSQVWLAVSGLFTLPVTQLAIQTWGVDRMLFGVDYPYVDTQRVPDYVKALNDVLAPSDVRKLLQTNAEELFKIRL